MVKSKLVANEPPDTVAVPVPVLPKPRVADALVMDPPLISRMPVPLEPRTNRLLMVQLPLEIIALPRLPALKPR
jgi:hypothetical protein